MAKQIPLTQGKIALVDDEDYPALSQHSWYANGPGGKWYAFRWDGEGVVAMHTDVIGSRGDLHVDHINGDGLDNRRSNLRFATRQQNQWNRKPHRRSDSTVAMQSPHKGVAWNARTKSWRVRICCGDGRRRHIGYFKKEVDAALAYNEAAKRYHGRFARLNQVEA